jgi:hypothetical protein
VLRIYWQGQQLDIGRLIFQHNRDSYAKALSDLATRLRLDVGDDSADPRPGDFWVGCHPRTGWGDADPELIGWASVVEVPLAVGLLNLNAINAVEEAIPIRIKDQNTQLYTRV